MNPRCNHIKHQNIAGKKYSDDWIHFQFININLKRIFSSVRKSYNTYLVNSFSYCQRGLFYYLSLLRSPFLSQPSVIILHWWHCNIVYKEYPYWELPWFWQFNKPVPIYFDFPLAAMIISFLLFKWNPPCGLLYLPSLRIFKNVIPEISTYISHFNISPLSTELFTLTSSPCHTCPCHDSLLLHFLLIICRNCLLPSHS